MLEVDGDRGPTVAKSRFHSRALVVPFDAAVQTPITTGRF